MNGFTDDAAARLSASPAIPARPTPRLALGMALGMALAAFCPGCIERTITINTEPQGATVFLNDQELGQTPVKTPFTWYGDYDIIIRKKGYRTLRTHKNVRTPWYQLPGIDLVTECLVPFIVYDDRVLDTFVLAPAQAPTREELLKAAAEMRRRAVSETD